MIKKTCLTCNKTFWVYPSRNNPAKYCSHNCQRASLETKEKLSKIHKGKPFSKEHKRKLSEHLRKLNLSRRGISLSMEIKEKISKSLMGRKSAKLGIPLSSETKQRISKGLKGKYRGKKSPAWRGGTSKTYQLHQTSREWDKIRKQVYKRDNYTCQICGRKNIKLHAHHIVPYRVSIDDSPSNLTSLCISCHSKQESKYYKRLKGQMEFNLLV